MERAASLMQSTLEASDEQLADAAADLGERLSRDNVAKDEQTLDIQFLGALPVGRTFEFRVVGSEEILSGKSAPGGPPLDPINEHRYQDVRARFNVTRVRNGKPRYQLLALPTWEGEG